MGLDSMRYLALVALAACASSEPPSPPPTRHDAAPTASAVLDNAPNTGGDIVLPCDRAAVMTCTSLDGSFVCVDVPLPCTPFDRLKDTPDPQP